MRKALPLVAAGITAFALTLLATLPAGVVARFLPPAITLGMTDGTLWKGSADALAVRGQPLGGLQWTLRPLSLLIGRLAFDGKLIRSDGQASGRVTLGIGGRLGARDLELHLPLSGLPAGIAPRGWRGVVHARLQSFELAPKSAPRIVGAIELRGLQAPPPGGAAIGSYAVTFPEKPAPGGKLVGQIKDLEGPMQVSGTVTIGADRSYVIEGMVAPRAGASQAVTDTLRFLGAPDAQGRRPFSLAGTY